MFGFNQEEMSLFRKLNTPSKIQDFLETLPINFEEKGETCVSPRRVLSHHKAHCFEGALFAAAALWIHGNKPLLLDLKATKEDDDHTVALFRQYHRWGAISKTNHAVLRYREPVYRTVRELALSYFHEYFTDQGKKVLKSYSAPFNLVRFEKRMWTVDEKDLWYISKALDRSKHFPVVPQGLLRHLRRADPIERKVGTIVQWRVKK